MGVLKASIMFSVPTATLRDYVNSIGKDADAVVIVRMGRKSVLPIQIRNETVNCCLLTERFFSD
jgi:hypothetical protein